MSDTEIDDEKPFFAETAKTGRAVCKKCKDKLPSGELRLAKLLPNPFGSGKIKHWYHVACLFEQFDKQRATTKRIESSDDIDGWSELNDLDRDLILERIQPIQSTSTSSSSTLKPSTTSIKKKMVDDSAIATTSTAAVTSYKKIDDDDDNSKSISTENLNKNYNENSKDNLFREFRRICAEISNESSYLGKTKILHTFLVKGANNKQFEGDIYLWIKLLLPNAAKQVYNLQSKQLTKIFSRIFFADHNEMLEHLEQGDVSETIRFFFENSTKVEKSSKSLLKLNDVDKFLKKLSFLTKEDEQVGLFTKICKQCTPNDLKTIIRLVKHDLRINAGPKHILEALGKNAYETFKTTTNLEIVVRKFGDKIPKDLSSLTSSSMSPKKKDGGKVHIMCPISPMLAEACKSLEKAIEKNPQGMYSEIKYDGERVQLHKKGNEFNFFTRNLKPVLEHKIHRCKEFITKAFPSANDLILDAEIIVVNTKTGELLPFGTLGIHKKNQFDSAEVCLFIFDCIYYNGEDLMERPLKERKKILEENIRPIKNHVQLSEYQFITSAKELTEIIAEVLQKGLEGLVLKNINGNYEPGKRRWLKIKKDYLFGGQMADSADLVVLGGWFGTGKKGGMLSIFLMGCFDKNSKLWKTVTKVHSGLDDKTMEELQGPFKSLMKRSNPDNPPKWLSCKKSMIPDYITDDPYKMPVWEITGAEFSKAEVHTADGISIRFPRITKQRHDKSPKEATNLQELQTLFENSKHSIDLKLLKQDNDDNEANKDTKKNIFKTSVQVKTEYDKNNPDEKTISIDEENVKKEKRNKKLKIPVVTKSEIKDEDDSDDNDSFDEKQDDTEHKQNLNLSKKRYYNRDIVKQEDVKKIKIKDEKIDEDDEIGNDGVKMKSKKMKLLFDENTSNNNSNDSSSNINQIKDVGGGDKMSDNDEKLDIEMKPIFNEIFVFITSKKIIKETKDVLNMFHKMGGKIFDESRKCNYVLHEHDIVNEDICILRQKYKPTCRHVKYNWLIDSVNSKSLLEPTKYPIKIKF